MTRSAQLGAPVSPLLVGASSLVAGVAVAASLLPSLGPRWVALARRCFDGGGAQADAAARAGVAALVSEAWGLVAWTLAPPLLASLGVALCAGLLQALAGRRERPEGAGSDGARGPRSPGLGYLAAVLTLTVAACMLAARQEQGALQAALAQGPVSSLTAAGTTAARVVLRVGVVLLGAGLADHLLRRQRLKAAWRAEQGRRGRREGEADPRLLDELRRRQRQGQSPGQSAVQNHPRAT